MEGKVQLHHPAGKKAVSMDRTKYDMLKEAILKHLKAAGESTHTELVREVVQEVKNNNRKFEGSIEWHMEWVKLDMEAKKEIIRISNKFPLKYKLV